MKKIFRFLACRLFGTRWRFQRDYDAAQLRDLAYARQHPDCTPEEAHRERDRVLWLYGR